ncbi:MAG: hypothetical protein QXD13_01530 [Candidatus Pacearchaeota archaeon]
MSYEVRLIKDKKIVEVTPRLEGGIDRNHKLGEKKNIYFENDKAELKIAYNYSKFYQAHLPGKGIEWLHRKKARETIEKLECAIEKLGTERDKCYFKAAPGNAGFALSILLGWAREHPEATWDVLT